MHSRSGTRIGDGEVPVALEEFRRKWNRLEVVFHRDDIRKPMDRKICDSRPAVIVHLGGHMSRPEAELDGFGGSCGPALPGEVWTVRRRQGRRITHAGHRFTMQCCSPMKPDYFVAVGQWHMDYMHCSRTSDDKVRRLLAEAGINSFAQHENRRTSCQLQKACIALEPLAGTPGDQIRPPVRSAGRLVPAMHFSRGRS